MATSNRLKPDPKSRKALKELSQKNILRRERVGIRHIIRAATGELEPVGLSHYWFGKTWTCEPSFCRSAPRLTAWVSYSNQRAELTASYVPDGYWTHHDLSSIPPANALSDKLLCQPDTKYMSPQYAGACCYGDAVLVTDNRMHWIFSNWKADAEDIEQFDAMLSTPREVLRPWGDQHPVIFFHEEPNFVDLVALKMRWA
jgi:hypothetical protein